MGSTNCIYADRGRDSYIVSLLLLICAGCVGFFSRRTNLDSDDVYVPQQWQELERMVKVVKYECELDRDKLLEALSPPSRRSSFQAANRSVTASQGSAQQQPGRGSAGPSQMANFSPRTSTERPPSGSIRGIGTVSIEQSSRAPGSLSKIWKKMTGDGKTPYPAAALPKNTDIRR
jgi:hypothetical protein